MCVLGVHMTSMHFCISMKIIVWFMLDGNNKDGGLWYLLLLFLIYYISSLIYPKYLIKIN